MSRVLAFGAVMASFVMVGCAAAAPATGEQEVEPEVATTADQQPLGTFLFEVDTSLPADQMVKVSDVTAVTKPITRPGQVAQAVTDVTSNVSVYNATTPVWNASGLYTTVKFGVWNLDATNALDEPYLQITSITVTSGSGTVTFQDNATPSGHTFVASALGSHTGGTYYLADMNKKCTGVGSGCTSSQTDFAVQQMKIKVTSSAMKYNFVANVYANQTSGTTNIYPDVDQDTWNTEPYAQKAGGDCDDATSDSPFPTCGSSGCTSSCPTSSSGACPTGGSSSCCSDSAATGFHYCPDTTPACTCSETFNNGSGSVDCLSGSTCTATYPPGGTGTTRLYCEDGATCNADCSNISTASTDTKNNCRIYCYSDNCYITCPAGTSVAVGGNFFTGYYYYCG